MKKFLFMLFVIIILTMLGNLSFAQNTTTQQGITPPLLMQQTQMQSVPSSGFTTVTPGIPSVPCGPGTIPGPPPGQIGPPPPQGMLGIPVVQTIPTPKLLENLQQAIVTAEKLNKLLVPGKVWIMRAPAGEIEIKGGLLYQGVVVAVLHFNPVNGTVLPIGINPRIYQSNTGIQSIKSSFSSIMNNLKILPAAEFIEPEACWSFPLVIDNAMVAHIKVYYDGIHILQDYIANQEMMFYGQ